MSKLSFFSKFFFSLAIVLALGQFSYLHPTLVQAAPLTEDMASLSTVLRAANIHLANATSTANPSPFVLVAAQTTRAALAAIQDHSKLTAQVILSSAKLAETSARVQLITAERLPKNTSKQRTLAYLNLAEAQIQTSRAQVEVSKIQTTLLLIDQAGLTLAQLDLAIAKGNAVSVEAATAQLAVESGAVSLSIYLAQSTAADAKTLAEAARVSIEIALTEVEVWINQAEADLDAARADLLATSPSFEQYDTSYTRAQQAVSTAEALLAEAVAARNRAEALKNVSPSTLTAAKTQADAAALAGNVANRRLLDEQVNTSLTGASNEAKAGFDFGSFAAKAVTPCAAVAASSLVTPLIIGGIAYLSAELMGLIKVPSTESLGILQSATTVSQPVEKIFRDCLIYSMGQLMLTNITESTVKWIQGGFNGSPSFTTDLNSILAGSEDIVGGDFVRQLRGIAVCDFTPTFKNDLLKSASTKKKSRNMFKDKVSCPFGSGSLSTYKASEFYKDFGKGGWRAFEASLSDQGNPFGVALISSQELSERKATQAEKDKEKRSWSAGFADIVDTQNCPNMPAQVKDYINGIDYDEDANRITIVPDPTTVKGLQKDYCKTTTPGKIVEGQLTKVLGTDIDRIGFADSIDKIIHTLITTLMQKTAQGIYKR